MKELKRVEEILAGLPKKYDGFITFKFRSLVGIFETLTLIAWCLLSIAKSLDKENFDE